jgi:hypothetical protein
MSNYAQHLERCFQNAEQRISKICQEIIDMDGMTGTKTRHFYNNLLDMNDARYLEIGTWKGSSVCSAMYKNKAKVVCIDNWNEFGGPRAEFFENISKFKGDTYCDFICDDAFQVDISELPKFNLYLYDGDHLEEAHRLALTHYIDAMDSTFIFVVDDWNWEQVRNGTRRAIDELGLQVVWEQAKECLYTGLKGESSKTWWNGMWAAVLQKP